MVGLIEPTDTKGTDDMTLHYAGDLAVIAVLRARVAMLERGGVIEPLTLDGVGYRVAESGREERPAPGLHGQLVAPRTDDVTSGRRGALAPSGSVSLRALRLPLVMVEEHGSRALENTNGAVKVRLRLNWGKAAGEPREAMDDFTVEPAELIPGFGAIDLHARGVVAAGEERIVRQVPALSERVHRLRHRPPLRWLRLA